MKVKLANTPSIQEGIDITNINQSLFIGGERNEETGLKTTIQINIEWVKVSDFQKYADFFKNGDVSTIEIYDNQGKHLITTLHGSTVESVTQNIQDNNSSIYVTINA